MLKFRKISNKLILLSAFYSKIAVLKHCWFNNDHFLPKIKAFDRLLLQKKEFYAEISWRLLEHYEEVNLLKLRKKLKFSSLIEVLSTSIVEQIFQQTIPEHNDFESHEKSTIYKRVI
uniref:Maturase K n=1 Tax=Romanomermis culicivorax TaxID=13658 RepID=A0A915IAT6_ROMCU